MDVSGLDPANLAVVIQLQLEDIAELESRNKGKGREDAAPADLDVALELHKAELEASQRRAADHAQALSIAQAVMGDAALIAELTQQEKQATEDRLMALSLDSGRQPAAVPNEVIDLTQDDSDDEERGANFDKYLDKLQVIYQEVVDEAYLGEGSGGGQAEGSRSAARRTIVHVGDRPKEECVACGDEHFFFDLATCACSHNYCRDCLQNRFNVATVDESMFPPQCCNRAMDLDTCRLFLTPDIVGRFLAKKLEYESPNRTYCHNSTCSAFIPPALIRLGLATGTCPRCHDKTCTTCKARWHGADTDCPDDPALHQLRRVATREGWKQCSNCKRMVELDTGCNHMSKCSNHCVKVLGICPLEFANFSSCPLQNAAVDMNFATDVVAPGSQRSATASKRTHAVFIETVETRWPEIESRNVLNVGLVGWNIWERTNKEIDFLRLKALIAACLVIGICV